MMQVLETEDVRPFREGLSLLQAFDHGKTVEEVARLSGRTDILDLAGNESTVGTSPKVARIVRDEASQAWHYPDPDCRELGEAIAARYRIDQQRISFGTGSEALLALIARAALDPGDRVIVVPPTFPIYASLANAQNAVVVKVPRQPDWTLDMRAMKAALTQQAKLTFLCNPNNPTGTPIPADQIAQIAEMIGPKGILVLDEAYHEFHQLENPLGSLEALEDAPCPWFVLRTFSKAYALGGFRVGYGIASGPKLTDMLDRIRPQFGVSWLAQRVAMAALSDRDHLTKAVSEIRSSREKLLLELRALGLIVAPSDANFLLIAAPDSLSDRLAHQGIIVRPVPGGYVRLTVCRLNDVERVIDAFKVALVP